MTPPADDPSGTAPKRGGIDPKLLEILVCPVCRKPLVLRGEESLKCNECKRVYPIRNGIPILLEHEATIETL